jgi:hypothetical protein
LDRVQFTVSIIIIIFVFGATKAQNITIPDSNFKRYLISNTEINKNNDSEIQLSEATLFTGIIDCRSLEIKDLSGIEYFTSLTKLIAVHNDISKIDISKLKNLEELKIWNNNLASINVSNNRMLRELGISENKISSIDLSKNDSLRRFNSVGNSIDSVDLSNNKKLNYFACCYDTSLVYLSLRNGNNTNLNYYNSQSTPNLLCIQVDSVSFSHSHWTSRDSNNHFSINCASTTVQKLSTLNDLITIYPNPASSIIQLHYDFQVSKIEIIDLTGKSILEFDKSYKIDISNIPKGIYFLCLSTSNGIVVNKIIKE